MTNSTNLVLPYLAVGQAQKHVTVNETIRRLDAVVQITVESATTTAEPGAPSDGETYIVPSGKTGTNWAAFTNWAIGYYRDGAWEQITPREGWLAWVRDSGALLVYDGAAWSTSDIRDGLGLGSAAVEDVGTSGANVPRLNGANTWGGQQKIASADSVTGLLLQGVSKGLRFVPTTSGFRAEGVDQTGSVSYQPFVIGGSEVQIATSGTARWRIQSTDFSPMSDNAYSLGTGSLRASVIYAATGTINTSDAREKTDLRALSRQEQAAIRRVMRGVGVFQWRDAVSSKGEDPAKGGARLHCGVTAQAVREAFAAEGLDAGSYGLFCADAVYEEVEVEAAGVETIKVRDEKGEVIEVETPRPAVTQTRPRIDPETGEQFVRLGVRYDQLFAMALGALVSGDAGQPLG